MGWGWIYLVEMLDNTAAPELQVVALYPPNIVTVSSDAPDRERCVITVKESGEGVLVYESMDFVMEQIARARPRSGCDPDGSDDAMARLLAYKGGKD